MEEAKQVGIIYHFTTIDTIKKVLNVEYMNKYGCDVLSFVSFNKHFSTTRDYQLTRNPMNGFKEDKYNIRIALDGDKLSNKYKIKPINGLTNNDSDVFGIDKNNNRVPYKSEKEEIICPFYSKGERQDFKLKDYVKEIQIYKRNSDDEVLLKELEIIIKKLKLKIKVTAVKKWVSFNEDYSIDNGEKIIGYEIMEMDIFNQDFLKEQPRLNEIKASDFILAFKIMKDLGRKWEDYDAYKLGLIDKDGKRLKYAETPKEKDAMTSYTKIIFNMKRLMGKVVKSNLGQKIVTAFLLKEDVPKQTIRKLVSEYQLMNYYESAKINENDEKIYINTFLEAHIIEY